MSPLDSNPFADLPVNEDKTEVKRRILKTTHPVSDNATKSGQATQKQKKTTSPKKQKAGKVSATFHINPELRDSLQSLAFVTRETQTNLVEEALQLLIDSRGLKLPKREVA